MEVKDCSVPYSFHILIILLHSKCPIAKAGLIYTLWTHQIFLCSYKVCELCPQVEFSEIKLPNNLMADYHTFCADVYTCLTCLLLPCISVCVCLCIHIHCVFMHYFVCTGHLAVQSINIWDLWNQVCSGESTLSVSWEKPGHTCMWCWLVVISYMHPSV